MDIIYWLNKENMTKKCCMDARLISKIGRKTKLAKNWVKNSSMHG